MYDNWWKTTFDRTKIMSTYLLACVVCDFDYVESMTQDGVQVLYMASSYYFLCTGFCRVFLEPRDLLFHLLAG